MLEAQFASSLTPKLTMHSFFTNKIPLLYILLTSINYLKTLFLDSQIIRLLHFLQILKIQSNLLFFYFLKIIIIEYRSHNFQGYPLLTLFHIIYNKFTNTTGGSYEKIHYIDQICR